MAKKLIGCINCGHPIEIYPPDDFHQTAARNKKELIQEDIIQINYKCPNCNTVNTIYWGSQSIGGVVA
jgi:Zn ribbon nucleic-acid-binding protein